MTFAFRALLKAGIAAGLRPEEVWRMTPAELNLVVRPIAGPSPLDRSRLDELLADFPDTEGD